jgi:Secretion system C-terminal sorting domain
MKKSILFLALFFAALTSHAQQYTLIPDLNFENALIAQNLDTPGPDGKVFTFAISSLTNLDVSNRGIKNLSGIQDFAALKTLNCGNNSMINLDVSKLVKLTTLRCNSNQLIALDVSKNIALTYLDCFTNQLTSLDITKNTAITNLSCYDNRLPSLNVSMNAVLTTLLCNNNQLSSLDVSKNDYLKYFYCDNNLLNNLDVAKNTLLSELGCGYNNLAVLDVSQNVNLKLLKSIFTQLTSLDVSKNTALVSLYCYSNKLTSLDVSKNNNLINFNCSSNQLVYLNISNGNNSNFDTSYSNFKLNSKLTCIQVDDVTYSNKYWTSLKDATATYNISCPNPLGLKEVAFATLSIYPNPTHGEFHIDHVTLDKALVYDALGKLVQTTIFANGATNNTLSLAGMPKGIYYVYLHSAGATTAKQIVVD